MLLEHEGKRPHIHESAYVAHGEMWSSHEPLSFPFLEFGLERPPTRRSSMSARRYSKALAKHKEDRILDEEGP